MKKKTNAALFLLLCFLFAFGKPQALQAQEPVTSRALIISRGDYGSKAQSLTPGPENDAKNFRRVLEQAYGDAITVTQLEKEGVTNAQGITQAVREAFSESAADTVNYFYYSGHGTSLGLYLGAGTMSAAQLAQAFEGIPGRNILVVDCCYSGGMISKGSRSAAQQTGADFSDFFIREFGLAAETMKRGRSALSTGSFHVLTAASSEEESWQGSLGEGGAAIGLFSSSLSYGCGIQPLKVNAESGYSLKTDPADYDRDGRITFDEIGSFIQNQVYSSNVRKYPEFDSTEFLPASSGSVPAVTFQKAVMRYGENGKKELSLTCQAEEGQEIEYAYYAGDLWSLSCLMRYCCNASLPFYTNPVRMGAGSCLVSGGNTKAVISLEESGKQLTSGNYAVMVRAKGGTYSYLLPFTVQTGEEASLLDHFTLQAEKHYFPADGEKELGIQALLGSSFREDEVRPYLSAVVQGEDGEIIRSLGENVLSDVVEQKPGSYSYYKKFYWEGADESGRPAPAGNYKFVVTARLGERTEVREEQVLLTGEENPLTGIRISRLPDQTSYIEGQLFSAEGMEVSALLKQGQEIPIHQYEVSPKEPLQPGDHKITVSFEGFSDYFLTEVKERLLVSLAVGSFPAKIAYIEGESFDPSGMKIFAVYNDGQEREVQSYEVLDGTGLTAGKTSVTIRYSSVTAQIPVTVGRKEKPVEKPVPVSGISLRANGNTISKKKLVIGVKEKVVLTPVISPANAKERQVSFRSYNKKLATVTQKGVLQGKRAGTVRIEAAAKNGKTCIVTVTVKRAPKKISAIAGKKILKRGKKYQIKVKLPGSTASYRMRYSSSKKKVANVSSTGRVTALRKGTAVITVKTFNGKKASIKITVK